MRVVVEALVGGGDPSVAEVSYQIPEGVGDVELRSVRALFTVVGVATPYLRVVSRNGDERWRVPCAAPLSAAAVPAVAISWSPDLDVVALVSVGAIALPSVALPAGRQLVRGDSVVLGSHDADAGDSISQVLVTYSYESASQDAVSR